MYSIKFQNNSGNWFTTECPDVSSANVIYQWKQTGGVCKTVQMFYNDDMIKSWKA